MNDKKNVKRHDRSAWRTECLSWTYTCTQRQQKTVVCLQVVHWGSASSHLLILGSVDVPCQAASQHRSQQLQCIINNHSRRRHQYQNIWTRPHQLASSRIMRSSPSAALQVLSVRPSVCPSDSYKLLIQKVKKYRTGNPAVARIADRTGCK